MSENKLNEMINTSLENLKKIVDVNTVVGEAIKTESGTVVIPISKVSLGFVSGGTDFASKKTTPTVPVTNFAGGGGSGVTILPLGFLVVKADGSVEFLAADCKSESGPVGNIVGLIEKSPDIIEKFRKMFSKKSSDKKKEEDKDEKEASEEGETCEKAESDK